MINSYSKAVKSTHKHFGNKVQTRNALLIFLLGLTFLACQKEIVMTQEEPDPIGPDTTAVSYQYLALGDSYTIGEGVGEDERFPEQLVAQLRQDNFAMEDPEIIARTGWTTDELAFAISRADLSDAPYDMVSLLIGVNNQFRGRSLENYQEQFAELLDQSIELAGADHERVIVLSIPDYGVTPFVQDSLSARRIADEIDRFNIAAAEICSTRQVLFRDITPISRLAATDRSLIASDSLHPSAKMYTDWVDLILPDAKRILN